MKPKVPYSTVAEVRKAQRQADAIIGAVKGYLARNLDAIVKEQRDHARRLDLHLDRLNELREGLAQVKAQGGTDGT